MTSLSHIVSLTVLLFLGTALAAPGIAAAAGSRFSHRHPRRAQVLRRTHHQQQRITRARRHGEIAPRHARSLRRHDRRIARSEQHLAHRQGGRISRRQQARLNRRLNANSRRIGG